MLKLLILDFDGTIIDSNYIKEIAINEFAKIEYGSYIKKSNLKNSRITTRYEQLSHVKGSYLKIEERRKLDQFVNNKVLKANIDKNLYLLVRLCKLKKIKIALVSNTPHESLLFLIKKLNMNSLFDGIYGKKDNSNKACLFFSILKLLSIKPQEALSIGDDFFDYLASRECNIPFIGIQNESLNIISSNNKVLKDLGGLVTLIKKLYK